MLVEIYNTNSFVCLRSKHLPVFRIDLFYSSFYLSVTLLWGRWTEQNYIVWYGVRQPVFVHPITYCSWTFLTKSLHCDTVFGILKSCCITFRLTLIHRDWAYNCLPILHTTGRQVVHHWHWLLYVSMPKMAYCYLWCTKGL